MLVDFRIKLLNFIRNNKHKIYILVIVLAVIIGVNIFLGKKQKIAPPTTSYEPHTPIVSGSEVKSKTIKENIESKINEYIGYCKEKKYDEAFNMITDDCKECRFDNNKEQFKKYIDYIFDSDKIYSIQDYSNKDNIYIYQVIISEDIMATGKNNEKSDEYYDEKIVITKNGSDYKLSVAGFISKEAIQKVSEDDYMKITVEEKQTFYDKIIYKVSVKNKTNYDIVFERNGEEDCIGIILNSETREEQKGNYVNTEKYVLGGDTKTLELTFSKYFDENKTPKSITFNKVRVLEKYTGVESLWEKELEKAINKYSASISL